MGDTNTDVDVSTANLQTRLGDIADDTIPQSKIAGTIGGPSEYDIPDAIDGDPGDGGTVTWQPNEIKTFRGGPAGVPGFLVAVQNFARTTDSATNLGDDITLENGVLSYHCKR